MNSKQKGKRGELEVAHILQEHGYDARRTAQYCGNTGEAADVSGLDGFHIEVKRCETTKIWDWIHQAQNDCNGKNIPIVVFRKSHEGWQVSLKLEDFLKIIGGRKNGNKENRINRDHTD